MKRNTKKALSRTWRRWRRHWRYQWSSWVFIDCSATFYHYAERMTNELRRQPIDQIEIGEERGEGMGETCVAIISYFFHHFFILSHVVVDDEAATACQSETETIRCVSIYLFCDWPIGRLLCALQLKIPSDRGVIRCNLHNKMIALNCMKLSLNLEKKENGTQNRFPFPRARYWISTDVEQKRVGTIAWVRIGARAQIDDVRHFNQPEQHANDSEHLRHIRTQSPSSLSH